MDRPFINQPKSSKEEYFVLEDGSEDFALYQSRKYEDGNPRLVYCGSFINSQEAKNICDRLNTGKMSNEDLWKLLDEKAVILEARSKFIEENRVRLFYEERERLFNKDRDDLFYDE